MLKYCVILGVLILAGSVFADDVQKIKVAVDPRIELVTIVCRLAGYGEYNRGMIISYNADIDKYFAPFKDHPAIVLARKLRKTNSIGYDAPMNLAVYMNDSENCSARVPLNPLPKGIDHRWTPKTAISFFEALHKFSKDTDFASFLKSHEELYKIAAKSMDSFIQKKRIPEWLDKYFGKQPGIDFIIVPSLVNGCCNYGSRATLQNGRKEVYSIAGLGEINKDGFVVFNDDFISIIVHEFIHSYVNPLVDKRIAEFKKSGEKIFPHVKNIMKSQAYATWDIVVYESVVRASCVRYLLAMKGIKAAKNEIEYNKGNGFIWTGELVELLDKYEKQRDKYPTLDEFMPQIVAFFNAYSERITQEMEARAEEERKQMEILKEKAPKILSIVPENGAMDVDSGLKVITVTFNRPIVGLAIMQLDSAKHPESAGKPTYDKTRTTLTIPVKLKPDKEYLMGFNHKCCMYFRDDQGNPLMPVVYKFKTKK